VLVGIGLVEPRRHHGDVGLEPLDLARVGRLLLEQAHMSRVTVPDGRTRPPTGIRALCYRRVA
jgi:hypothetical protein